MIFNDYNLYLYSDLEIRIVRENDTDLDLLVPLNNKTLNMFFYDMPKYLMNPFQLKNVYGMMIRITKSKENNIATLHIMDNIDLNASMINFELQYERVKLELTNHTYYCQLQILNKES